MIPLMKPILGIDISKDKFDCCLLQGEEKLPLELPNNKTGFKQLQSWLGKNNAPPETLHVCMEATGRYGDNLAHYLFSQKFTLSIVNPAQIKYYARSRLARNKTDRVDAFIIAAFCRSEPTRPWAPPTLDLARLQALNRLLATRKEQLTQERLRDSCAPACLKPAIRLHARFLERQTKALQKQIDTLIGGSAEFKTRHALLCSIPCIGSVTAQTVLAELPKGIASAREAAAYAGLTPRRDESGQRQGRSRLSKTGNTHLRKALYMPAVGGLTHNARLKACAERMKQKGKCPASAIGACMHLLMRLCFGVLASGQPYQENWLQRDKTKTSATTDTNSITALSPSGG